MANYPCPVCGASHKTPVDKCRLCGQRMDEDADVGDFSGARTAAPPKKGIGGLAVLVAIGVTVLLLALVIVGVLPGKETITGLAANVPGVGSDDDLFGWALLEQPEDGFTIMLPSTAPELTTDSELPVPVEGERTSFTAWVGDETMVRMSVTANAKPDGMRAFDAIGALAEEWSALIDEDDGIVENVEELFFANQPARIVRARSVLVDDLDGAYFAKVFMLYNRDTLYTLEVYTTDDRSTVFERALGSFRVLDPAPREDSADVDSTTTTAPDASP